MGGKSRKTGQVSYKLIEKIKKGSCSKSKKVRGQVIITVGEEGEKIKWH